MPLCRRTGEEAAGATRRRAGHGRGGGRHIQNPPQATTSQWEQAGPR